MDHRKVIVIGQKTAFARHLEKLGEVAVCEVGKRFSDVQGTVSSDCEAIYWPMDSACHIQKWHVVRSLLRSMPADVTRILDFNLRVPYADKMHFVKESLKHCDLLKIDEHEFTAVCTLLGLTSQHVFDNAFMMMSQFNIETLILTHGIRGCHVFHGNAVSEKWGFAGLGDRQSEEAEAAFLASFYVASRQRGRVFTECHRIAFEYMRQQYENHQNSFNIY